MASVSTGVIILSPKLSASLGDLPMSSTPETLLGVAKMVWHCQNQWCDLKDTSQCIHTNKLLSSDLSSPQSQHLITEPDRKK